MASIAKSHDSPLKSPGKADPATKYYQKQQQLASMGYNDQGVAGVLGSARLPENGRSRQGNA